MAGIPFNLWERSQVVVCGRTLLPTLEPLHFPLALAEPDFTRAAVHPAQRLSHNWSKPWVSQTESTFGFVCHTHALSQLLSSALLAWKWWCGNSQRQYANKRAELCSGKMSFTKTRQRARSGPWTIVCQLTIPPLPYPTPGNPVLVYS